MGGFRFLHTADIHLDSPMKVLSKKAKDSGLPLADELKQAIRSSFDRVVQIAIDEGVAFVLIAGDIYDGDWEDFHTGLYFSSKMKMLEQKGIPVFFVLGNHDAENQITKNLSLPKNVTVCPTHKPESFRLDHVGVAVHGQSFAREKVENDLARDYPPPKKGLFNIGLLHTALEGHSGPHARYAPCRLEALKNTGYQYWALGHVHTHQVLTENPHVVYPGNIQGRDINELGKKGCVVVHVDDRGNVQPSFRPVDRIRWIRVEADISGAEGSEDRALGIVKDALEAEIDKAKGAGFYIARVVFTGQSGGLRLQSERDGWLAKVRSKAPLKSWIEKVEDRTKLPPPAMGAVQRAILENIQSFDEKELKKFYENDPDLLSLEDKLPPELLELKEMLKGKPGDVGDFEGGLLKQAIEDAKKRLMEAFEGGAS